MTFDEVMLIAASRFFDAHWYLARYPDVAEAGINPLVHFVERGGAEGRDPSPHFNTRWYRARYPDAAQGGQNPLLHYLTCGSKMGFWPSPAWMMLGRIEPLGSVPATLERYARMPPRDPLEKVDDTNCVELRELWAERFLADGARAHQRDDLPAALECFMRAVQVCPELEDGFRLFRHAYIAQNEEAFTAFQGAGRKARMLVAHVTCRPRLHLAQRSASTFSDERGEIENVFVVGDAQTRGTKCQYDAGQKLLMVPESDSYEGLPRKVISMFRFLTLCGPGVPVLKVDDDIHCRSVSVLLSELEMLKGRHYAGYVVPSPSRFLDCHLWHFGKCEDQSFNTLPDGLFFREPYVAGPYYLLDPAAQNVLTRAALIHGRWFDIETYEDRAVGMLLAYYGIGPYQWRGPARGALRVSSLDPSTGE